MNFTALREDSRFNHSIIKLRNPATRKAVLQASGIQKQDFERSVRNRAIAETAHSFEEGERIAAQVSTYRAPVSRKEAAARELLPNLVAAAEAHSIAVSTALSLALAYASCEESSI